MADPQHIVCTASVWPHRHTNELTGPLDVKISHKNQPPSARNWPKKQPVWIKLEQPDERTNLTIIRLRLNEADGLLYLWDGDEGWYRVNQCRVGKDSSLKFYIKSRITRQMEHPIPRGNWKGTCECSSPNGWKRCVYTFQAMTMRVKPEDEPKIVLPDGSLPVKKTRIIIP